jgi:hypothetical protein
MPLPKLPPVFPWEANGDGQEALRALMREADVIERHTELSPHEVLKMAWRSLEQRAKEKPKRGKKSE